MTFVRTAVRLLTVAALTGTTGNRPTIAEDRIYDSLNEPLAAEDLEKDKAILIVLTDQDKGDALSHHQNGGPPFLRDIDLVIECAMQARGQADDETFVVGTPATDSELEASLDTLEAQAWRRLAYDPDPLCVLWRKIVRPMSTDSHRQASDDSGVRLAARQWTWCCRVNDDDWDIALTTDTPAAGFALLPNPLRTVCQALTPGSDGFLTCTAIAAAITPLTVPPLEGIDTRFDAGDPPVNADEDVIVGKIDFPPEED